MDIDYVPVLQIHRELHRTPRGMDRFREYLHIMLDDTGQDLAIPPLVIVNPMAREHVAVLLDALLAFDADALAARTIAEALPKYADLPGCFKASLVVIDNVGGGWTNRYSGEFGLRFSDPSNKRFWLLAGLWSSDPASEQMVRETVLAAVHRTAYQVRHGLARTLRERMAQEGYALARAGCTRPTLDEEDLEYTRTVLEPYLDAEDMRTAIECLHGDAAARTLGFTPLGLSPDAGLALALHDARRFIDAKSISPCEVVPCNT